MFNEPGYRFQKYLPFETINDIIDQFNYVGYHDVCIYPSMSYLSRSSDRTNNMKGLAHVHVGHLEKNQTGKYTKIKFDNITFII